MQILKVDQTRIFKHTSYTPRFKIYDHTLILHTGQHQTLVASASSNSMCFENCRLFLKCGNRVPVANINERYTICPEARAAGISPQQCLRFTYRIVNHYNMWCSTALLDSIDPAQRALTCRRCAASTARGQHPNRGRGPDLLPGPVQTPQRPPRAGHRQDWSISSQRPASRRNRRQSGPPQPAVGGGSEPRFTNYSGSAAYGDYSYTGLLPTGHEPAFTSDHRQAAIHAATMAANGVRMFPGPRRRRR